MLGRNRGIGAVWPLEEKSDLSIQERSWDHVAGLLQLGWYLVCVHACVCMYVWILFKVVEEALNTTTLNFVSSNHHLNFPKRLYFLCNLSLLNITRARTYSRENCWFSRGKMDHFLLNFLSSTTLFLIPTPHHRGCLPTTPVVEINMILCYPKVLISTSASACEFFTLMNCVRGWPGHSECLVLYSELACHLTLSESCEHSVPWHSFISQASLEYPLCVYIRVCTRVCAILSNWLSRAVRMVSNCLSLSIIVIIIGYHR